MKTAGASQPLLIALIVIWLLGCSWTIYRLLREAIETWSLRNRSKVVDDLELSTECARLATQMRVRHAPEILCHEGIGTPLLIGITRPAIVLPGSFREQFDQEQQRLILAHEMAHLQRADLKWAWLARIARCLFFFHPLVWLAEREWQQSQEMACDQQVLRLDQVSPAAYGGLLLQVVYQPRGLLSGKLAAMRVADSYSTVKRRLNAMKQLSKLSRRRMVMIGSVVAIGGVVALVPWRVVAAEARNLYHAGAAAGQGDVTGLLSKQMMENLKLDEAQVNKIRAANEVLQKRINETLTHGQKEQLANLASIHHAAMEKLGATAEQSKQLHALMAKQESDLRAIQSDSKLPRAEKEERLKSVKANAESEMMKLLTPEQRTKAKAIHADVQKQLASSPNEEQRQAVVDLHNNLQAKATAINNDSSLSQEDKDRRMEELKRYAEEKMSRIMTDEQRKNRSAHNASGAHVSMGMNSLMSLKTLTNEQRMKIEAAYLEMHKQIEDTLTPEQRAKLKEMHHRP
jgi:beta-lactamase regulating signal transducer with metallopeptidase domain